MATQTILRTAVCTDCGSAPDKAWKKQGGDTDDNVWQTTQSCRKCWTKFQKKERCEFNLASLRASYSYNY